MPEDSIQSRNIRRVGVVIAVFAVLIALVALGFAWKASQNSQGRLQSSVIQAKTIHASYILYPPTVSAGSDPAKPTGFLIDIMNEIAARSGMTVIYAPTSFDDFSAALNTGGCDIVVAGVFENVPRAKRMAFTHALVYWEGVTGVASTEKAQSYSTLSDLNNPAVRIAVTAGTAEYDFVKRTFPAASIMARTDSDISLTLAEVSAGRADVAFADAVTVRKYLVGKVGLQTLFGNRKLNTFATCFVVRQDDAAWLNFLNSAIDSMQNDGTIEALSKKYGGDELWILPHHPWE